MKFNNRQNTLYRINGKLVWESRSVAVNCVILIWINSSVKPYVLVSKRGPKAADYHGLMNIIAGYLDWDETGPEAVIRETWEECGLNLNELIKKSLIINNDLDQPWHVKTDPSANHQNVSLRYGIGLYLNNSPLPSLSLDNNEIKGEVELATWIPIDKIDQYQWAFEHDEVIKEYLKRINHNKLYL